MIVSPATAGDGQKETWDSPKVFALLRVTALLVWARFSAPYSSLAKVLSTTQLFPTLIPMLLPGALGRSQGSPCCTSVWFWAIQQIPEGGAVLRFPRCGLSLADSGCSQC